ncbi:probable inactive histone-lysine N-methyltransferase SUVR2 [Rutidosis leptorrhynchoides]|uniref:probable inactive histone-lysine N-methyltransferase SUVR2 n=1 Tax=Rutidosis leptorrhynchoides TaxID=125765 RepID=UPI003A98E91E
MAPNPQVAKAFRAMRAIGIREETTKPVLKKLVKLYDRNWELIEQENYRVLADAIFDYEEEQAAEQKKKMDNAEEETRKKLEQAEILKAIEEETQIQEEPERPLKRSRNQESQSSTSCINPSTSISGSLLKKPKLEVEEPPESQPKLHSPVKTVVTEPVLRPDSQPNSPLTRSKNKGKQPILPKPLIKPKDEPLTEDEPPCSEVNYILVNEPTETMGVNNYVQAQTNETSGHDPTNIPDEQTDHDPKNILDEQTDDDPENVPDEQTDDDPRNVLDEPTDHKLDIASSSDGDIKISVSCTSPHGKPKFSVTNVDTILKIIEDKTMKSYKVLNPNFSLKKFMKDMCECLVDLQCESTNEAPVSKHAVPPSDAPSKVNGSVKPDSEKQVEQNGTENNSHLDYDDVTRSIDDVHDIAKGQESVIISVVNEVNKKRLPSFHYITRNAVFQNAYVNFSLACIASDNCCPNCSGDCLTSSTPCLCVVQSDGEFAYTTEGLVKEDVLDECIKMNRDPEKHSLSYCKECPLERCKTEGDLEPCKGHSARSFIKECWLKCGCNKKCGNRVVQCGIKRKLQVFMTSGGTGWGLRSLEDLPKGSFVCEYVGELLTCYELYNRVSQSPKKNEYAYPVLLDAEWGDENDIKDEKALCLDATYYGNVARFINHRCFDANLIEISVEVENSDRHYYRVALFTTREVKALEELTRDYGIDFDDDTLPVRAFQCKCGSQFCRNIKQRSTRSSKRRSS